MSTLVVEVCEVKAVYPHPQADSLEFIAVKGWQVIVRKTLGLTYGPTTLCPPKAAGRFQGREGCVVTSVVERYDPDLGGGGQVILKSISADYLARKGGTDEH